MIPLVRSQEHLDTLAGKSRLEAARGSVWASKVSNSTHLPVGSEWFAYQCTARSGEWSTMLNDIPNAYALESLPYTSLARGRPDSLKFRRCLKCLVRGASNRILRTEARCVGPRALSTPDLRNCQETLWDVIDHDNKGGPDGPRPQRDTARVFGSKPPRPERGSSLVSF
jgi:hypothetical protein